MSLDGDARAKQIYLAILQANPKISALSGPVGGDNTPSAATYVDAQGKTQPSEKYALLQQLKTLWGADTTYLTSNAEIAPGSLAAASAIPVTTSGSPTTQTGTTTANGPLVPTGRGKLT